MEKFTKYQKSAVSQRGMAMVETLGYIFILVLLVSLLVNTLVTLNNDYKNIRATQNIEDAAQTGLERIMRETRDAISVDTTQSVFDQSPGTLTLNSLDSNGATTTETFFLSGQSLHLKKAGVDAGPLTPSEVQVTSLIFHHIITAESQAIKIDLTLASGGSDYQSKTFNATAVLRGSYPLQ